MSPRTHLVSIAVLAVLSAACGSQGRAQDVSPVQDSRQWAADVVRGEDSNWTEVSASGDIGKTLPARIQETFMRKGQILFAQAGQLVEQRIGWLRPTTVKEQALVWMAIAFALPWAFVSWLRPILKHDFGPVRWIIVGLWTSLALWTAWITWGAPSGSDRFTSTMLIGLPVLLIYFNCVAISVAGSGESLFSFASSFAGRLVVLQR